MSGLKITGMRRRPRCLMIISSGDGDGLKNVVGMAVAAVPSKKFTVPPKNVFCTLLLSDLLPKKINLENHIKRISVEKQICEEYEHTFAISHRYDTQMRWDFCQGSTCAATSGLLFWGLHFAGWREKQETMHVVSLESRRITRDSVRKIRYARKHLPLALNQQ